MNDSTDLLAAKRKDVLRAIVPLLVGALVACGFLGINWWLALDSRDSWREQTQQARDRNTELVDKYTLLYEQYISSTGQEPPQDTPQQVADDPILAPQVITGEAGPQGLPGPVGPRGPRGIPGDDGSDGATGETGAQGETGLMGPPGPNGQIGSTGAQGPKGDTGQQGPAGPKGDQGERGADGRGIASLTCSEAGELIVTYTDGQTAVIALCEPLPAPEVPEPETP